MKSQLPKKISILFLLVFTFSFSAFAQTENKITSTTDAFNSSKATTCLGTYLYHEILSSTDYNGNVKNRGSLQTIE